MPARGRPGGLHAVAARASCVRGDRCWGDVHVVASALGHSSPATTQAHYIAEGTVERARTRKMIERLDAPAKPVRSVGIG